MMSWIKSKTVPGKVILYRMVMAFFFGITLLLYRPAAALDLENYTLKVAQSADEISVAEALEDIRNGDIERGVVILQRLGGQGNADSLFHMGELFRLGIGRDKASDIAAMYYRLATALGHKRAALSLANLLFFDGDNSDKTVAEALGIWQSLAMEGNMESLYLLGMIYWNGEAGLAQDPVRGYGLVWRAAQEGYADAVQNELTMRSLLNLEARNAAMKYGNALDTEGFGSDPLALDLVVAASPELSAGENIDESEPISKPESTDVTQQSAPAAKPEEKEVPLEKPEDWRRVWRLEVGFAMSEVEVRRLRSMLNQTQQETVGQLFSEVQPSINRPGLFRLIYGPMKGMLQAVNSCVSLKRAGHDCSAKAPE